MRVAMVSEHASPLATLGGVDAGGQNVHVAELAAALAARGHDVVVYTRRDDPGLPQRVPMGAVVVEHLDAGPAVPVAKDELVAYVPAMAHDLARRLAADPPDVVHAHFWMSGLACLAAARPGDLPVVQTFHALGSVKRRHQGAADTSPASRIPAERRIVLHASRLIASCTDERRELLRMGARASRVDVVPSGVDLRTFSAGGERAPRGALRRLLCIGRLVPRKGVEDAIRATAELDGVELVVVGGPDVASLDADAEVRRLRALAAGAGVAGRVRFTGSIPHDRLAPVIRSADAVLCLPWYEPFGIVPLEAMACGVPVVATGVGGLLDTVEDGVTGLHVPPRDPGATALAVRALLEDESLRARLGRGGRERVRRYAWSQVASDVEATYLRASLRTVGVCAREEVAG